MAGYDPNLQTAAQVYDPAAARALLDKFGYKDRDGDGYRETPDGKPLAIERWSVPTSSQRLVDELWKKNMDAIGFKLEIRNDRLPELRKMARQGKIPMRTDGWNADYPDAENFMQLLYGPNIGQSNDSRFNLPEFNRLFEQASRLPDSPERTKLFDRMTELVVAYAPWRLTVSIVEDSFAHPWVRDFVPHPIRIADLDVRRRRTRRAGERVFRRGAARQSGFGSSYCLQSSSWVTSPLRTSDRFEFLAAQLHHAVGVAHAGVGRDLIEVDAGAVGHQQAHFADVEADHQPLAVELADDRVARRFDFLLVGLGVRRLRAMPRRRGRGRPRRGGCLGWAGRRIMQGTPAGIAARIARAAAARQQSTTLTASPPSESSLYRLAIRRPDSTIDRTSASNATCAGSG